MQSLVTSSSQHFSTLLVHCTAGRARTTKMGSLLSLCAPDHISLFDLHSIQKRRDTDSMNNIFPHRVYAESSMRNALSNISSILGGNKAEIILLVNKLWALESIKCQRTLKKLQTGNLL